MRGRKKSVNVIVGTVADAGGDIAEPPGLTPAASAKWASLVPVLAALCPLVQTDADAIAQYCEAWALRQRALHELHQDGVSLVNSTPNGAQQINPLITIARQQEAVMMRLSERFGLDPASRQRLKIAKNGDSGSDDFGDYLKDSPNGRSASDE